MALRWTADSPYLPLPPGAKARLENNDLVMSDGRIVPPPPIDGFVPAAEFSGARRGFVYKNGREGLGYYVDVLVKR